MQWHHQKSAHQQKAKAKSSRQATTPTSASSSGFSAGRVSRDFVLFQAHCTHCLHTLHTLPLADHRGVSCVISTGCSKISETFSALFWWIKGNGNDGPSVTSSLLSGVKVSRLALVPAEDAPPAVCNQPSDFRCCRCSSGEQGDATPSPSSTEKGNPRKASNPLAVGRYSGCWPRCLWRARRGVSGVQWHHQGHIDVHVSTKAHHHTASQYVLHPEAPTFRPAPPGTSMFSSLPLPDGQALVPLRAHIIC